MIKLIFLILLNATSTFAEVIWHPLPAEAYQFGKLYPEAQKILFAFDYGHALVYEKLLQNRGKITDPEKFEKELLEKVFYILRNPPSVKTHESDIAPNYYYLFTKTVTVFDWSHLLHQFVLDIMATSVDRNEGMKKRVYEIYNEYLANKRIAITPVCKTMEFMDGHYFSKAFRRQYPSLNLLIWSYHFFQIKIYEALMEPTRAARDEAVKNTLNEFWKLIENLPDSADFVMMPETATEAPRFAKMFPGIPSAFDNNHMLHDIVSDLLNSPKVEFSNLRSEASQYASMAMDPEAFRSATCDSTAVTRKEIRE